MSREILLLVDALASEKNVSKNVVFTALEMALASATKKKFSDKELDVRVEIDRNTGSYNTFRRWTVVEGDVVDTPDNQLTLEQAKARDPMLEIDSIIEVPMEPIEFGRIGAQTAKQVILQRIREAEREQLLNEFLQRKESIVMGTIKRIERGSAIIELKGGRLEAILPRDYMIPKETLRVGDPIKAALYKIDRNAVRGPQIILSRTSNDFLIRLFEQEVPEIEDGGLEIKVAARDPGLRAKIAVKSNDPRIEPQGTCIGVRGSRVQAVTQELAGERIDVILWAPDVVQFVINALSPASVARIRVDEEKNAMDVVVEDDQLALAIGRMGQNVKLATELTGWHLNIMTVNQADERYQAEDAALSQTFIDLLGVDEATAMTLVQEGFTSLEEVAYVPVAEMLEIEGFDETLVNHLRMSARDALLNQAMAEEAKPEDEDLASLGLSVEQIAQLAENEILTRDDLADLTVDELMEIVQIEKDDAAALIMKAREHWFK